MDLRRFMTAIYLLGKTPLLQGKNERAYQMSSPYDKDLKFTLRYLLLILLMNPATARKTSALKRPTSICKVFKAKD